MRERLMSLIDQFQKLDDLIRIHTTPEVQAILRNQLHLATEQIEAYQASSDKQDATLARQAETIANLEKENARLTAEHCNAVSALEGKHHELELKFQNSHRCGVALRNGTFVPYDADTYAILPNATYPKIVQFHKTVDKDNNIYRVVGHARWSEVALVQAASGA